MGSYREKPPGSGRWQLRVYAGTTAGRRRYATRTVEGTERDARKALARLEVAVEDRRAPLPGQGTTGELLEAWLRGKPWRSSGSRRQAREDLERYLIPELGSVPLVKLDHHRIDALYAGLLDGTRSKSRRPLKPATVRRLHANLHMALSWGVTKGRLALNPASRATAPATPPTAVVAPERHEIRLLLDRAAPEGFATFLRIAAATGRRRGDILGLQIGDVVADEGALVFARRAVVPDTGSRVIVEDLDKNRRSARLDVDPATMEAITAHLGRIKRRSLRLGVALGRRAYLFSNEIDASIPWRPDAVTRRFSDLAEACGLGDLTLHGLRHAHATELLVAGVDVETVARRIGDDPRTVYRVYSHFRPAADRRAAQVWGDLLGDGGDVTDLTAT